MLKARVIVFSQIITTAKPAQTEPQKKKTPWWVIFLSVLGGVLLLGGAAAVLWKVRLSLLTTKSTYSDFFILLLSCCYMAYVCSRKNPLSDWLILGHYSPVIPKGPRPCKYKSQNQIINNLLTSNLEATCHVDLAIVWSIRQGLDLRFSRKNLTLG